MTKKSATRIARDEAKAEQTNYLNHNTVFDDLNKLHGEIAHQFQSFASISVLANDEDLTNYLENREHVTNQVKLLATDLQKLIGDFNATFEQHKDLKGGAKDPDSHMQALTIYQNYAQIATVIDAVILPTVTSILDDFRTAELRRNQERAASDSQAPVATEKEVQS